MPVEYEIDRRKEDKHLDSKFAMLSIRIGISIVGAIIVNCIFIGVTYQKIQSNISNNRDGIFRNKTEIDIRAPKIDSIAIMQNEMLHVKEELNLLRVMFSEYVKTQNIWQNELMNELRKKP